MQKGADDQNISEKGKEQNKKKEYMKDYRKIRSYNVFMKTKENDELKVMKVGEVKKLTTFTKNEVEDFSSDDDYYHNSEEDFEWCFLCA